MSERVKALEEAARLADREASKPPTQDAYTAASVHAAFAALAQRIRSLASHPSPQVDEGHDWIRVHKPTLDDLAAIGEIAEGALLSEKGWAEIGHAVWDHITIDAEVTDWSSAIRGKFHSGKPALSSHEGDKE